MKLCQVVNLPTTRDTLLALGSLEELDQLRLLINEPIGNIGAILNSSFGIESEARKLDVFPFAHSYEWEPCLLSKQFFSESNSDISLSDLKSIELLILRRLYLRHIESNNNHNTFELVSLLMLRWIVGLLRKHSIQRIYCAQIPHQYVDYLLIPAARLLGIKILVIKSIQVYHSDAYRIWDPLENVYLDTSSLPSYSPQKVDEFVTLIYKRLVTEDVPYTTQRLAREQLLRSTVSQEVLESVMSADTNVSDITNEYLKNKIEILEYTNKRSVSPGDTSADKKYIVLFLHFEPECNVCPLGNYYYDQLTFIDAVNRICSKLGMYLLIREHPVQLRLPLSGVKINQHFLLSRTRRPRDLSYYELITRFSRFTGFCQTSSVNDILSSPSIASTASVAGTISLQSAIRGIPSLVGTSQWFDRLPGIIRIDCGEVDLHTARLQSLTKGNLKPLTQHDLMSGIKDTIILK